MRDARALEKDEEVEGPETEEATRKVTTKVVSTHFIAYHSCRSLSSLRAGQDLLYVLKVCPSSRLRFSLQKEAFVAVSRKCLNGMRTRKRLLVAVEEVDAFAAVEAEVERAREKEETRRVACIAAVRRTVEQRLGMCRGRGR